MVIEELHFRDSLPLINLLYHIEKIGTRSMEFKSYHEVFYNALSKFPIELIHLELRKFSFIKNLLYIFAELITSEQYLMKLLK